MIVTVQAVAFYVLAAVIIAAAIAVVRVRNIFHAGLSLSVVLTGVAGIFLMLKAEFLAGMQVLIYAGAVIVLILFAIMLTQGIHRFENDPHNGMQLLAFLSVAAISSLTAFILLTHKWPEPVRKTVIPTWESFNTLEIGRALVREFALPFELISVLLLAAVLGAIMIARRKSEKGDSDDGN